MCKGLEEILNNQFRTYALIIGNGINRSATNNESWEDLLFKLWTQYSKNIIGIVNNEDFFHGISLIEFYDALELATKNNKLQKHFCDLMDKWKYNEKHIDVTKWALQKNIPILTTNFETTFHQALTNIAPNVIEYKYEYEFGFKFTETFPWNLCYKINSEFKLSNKSFAIWHINGISSYSKSIRLGLSHYMQAVYKARKLIHGDDNADLFNEKNINNWVGSNTWLNIIFNNDLIIFGLGLDQSEVFLRWLLMQRAAYYIKFPYRKKERFYIQKKSNKKNMGKEVFLNAIGFKIIEENDYSDIYNAFKE
jgi:hypothetical protein